MLQSVEGPLRSLEAGGWRMPEQVCRQDFWMSGPWLWSEQVALAQNEAWNRTEA